MVHVVKKGEDHIDIRYHNKTLFVTCTFTTRDGIGKLIKAVGFYKKLLPRKNTESVGAVRHDLLRKYEDGV